ncbi:hypothetical protein [Streptomyces sp. SID13726]|uniref:hypothetical protein n=1 Tax=Streptomyces sp. SID13726 TaxID=2706058 RepID=UPI0013B99DAB|nr:hypothetical protein [Streptomyces sp. SID13726]NEB00409.1 hypothetical protein [Streptomyces sp. SID13726]
MSVIDSDDHRGDRRDEAPVAAEALRVVGRERRPVLGSALVACTAALLVGGGIVAAGFAVSWGLFLAARRDAEYSIESEDSYVAYADQWDSLVKVAYVVYPLLLLVAVALTAWLFTTQAVVAGHARERARAATDTGTDPGALTLRALWRRSRPHLGAALRVQSLTLVCVSVPALAGLLVLVLIELEMVPGVVWPTYHDPATVQFVLVGRILPVVIWALGFVLLARFAPATAVRVADNSSATAAMRRSWRLTRTARLRTTGNFLLGAAAVAVAYLVLKWLGTYVAHWAGLLMLATTDDNVWVTGVLVLITPVAVALVLLPLALAPMGVLLACLHERLDGGVG